MAARRSTWICRVGVWKHLSEQRANSRMLFCFNVLMASYGAPDTARVATGRDTVAATRQIRPGENITRYFNDLEVANQRHQEMLHGESAAR